MSQKVKNSHCSMAMAAEDKCNGKPFLTYTKKNTAQSLWMSPYEWKKQTTTNKQKNLMRKKSINKYLTPQKLTQRCK